MKEFTFNQIGIIETPFERKTDMPIQAAFSNERGIVHIFESYEPGLTSIEKFSHIILLYVFHKSQKFKLLAKPFLDNKSHGIFAIRGPNRPNHIGLSIVSLIKREKNRLFVRGVDMLDGTPLLDIKPYVPAFDSIPQASSGWLTGKINTGSTTVSDDRFLK
ncbi:MAG: tRNA (N6-threonylcarbamoyladenosine(37)-N6)-methyltransferase TrmO [Promethearchaeota archaeon]